MGNVIEEFKKHNEFKKAAKDAGITKEESKMEDNKKSTPEGQDNQENNSGAGTPNKESKKGKILGFVKKAGGYALAGLGGAAAVVLFAMSRKDNDPDEADDDSEEDDQQEETEE